MTSEPLAPSPESATAAVKACAVPTFDFNAALAQRYVAQQKATGSEDATTAKTAEEPAADSTTAPTKTKRVRVAAAGERDKKDLPKAITSTLRYADLGGIEGVLEEIRDLVERPFRFPELYRHLGVEPPRGILLHGAPGSGKTSLAMAIAGELGVALLKVSAPELVSGMSGESESRIRELFEQARLAAPCLLFIDEIDAITPKRETAQREMERRIVAQLLTCMDELGRSSAMVMVVGATNRPDSLDPALRRAGRFDRELQLSIPNEDARLRILQVLTAKIRLTGSVGLQSIARNTPGYVGADLKALTQEAANVAIRRIFSLRAANSVVVNDPEEKELASLASESPSSPPSTSAPLTEEELQAAGITPDDFAVAMGKIQPSAKREGFAVVPDTKWEDIGALGYVRDELRMAVVEPIRHPEKFMAVGISAPAGVLLWGPPGCGKTLLAKAVANESHSNFISVKGPELLNKYVGESERAVRQVFERARHSAPCVVFFDELDALCPRRTDEADSATSRVVNQLLTEMDGLEDRRQVFVLAATNRPDMIDPAMTRPGRLDKMLYVNLPTPAERVEILQAVGRKTPWAVDVDLTVVAQSDRCANFSGADLAALVREASLAAVREAIERDNSMQLDEATQSGTGLVVSTEHLEAAFSRVSPSVAPRDLANYERILRERRQQ